MDLPARRARLPRGPERYGPDGTYIHEDERWSERRAGDMPAVEQILRVNGWMLAYRFVLGERLLDWRGPREARVPRAETRRRSR